MAESNGWGMTPYIPACCTVCGERITGDGIVLDAIISRDQLVAGKHMHYSCHAISLRFVALEERVKVLEDDLARRQS